MRAAVQLEAEHHRQGLRRKPRTTVESTTTTETSRPTKTSTNTTRASSTRIPLLTTSMQAEDQTTTDMVRTTFTELGGAHQGQSIWAADSGDMQGELEKELGTITGQINIRILEAVNLEEGLLRDLRGQVQLQAGKLGRLAGMTSLSGSRAWVLSSGRQLAALREKEAAVGLITGKSLRSSGQSLRRRRSTVSSKQTIRATSTALTEEPITGVQTTRTRLK